MFLCINGQKLKITTKIITENKENFQMSKSFTNQSILNLLNVHSKLKVFNRIFACFNYFPNKSVPRLKTMGYKFVSYYKNSKIFQVFFIKTLAICYLYCRKQSGPWLNISKPNFPEWIFLYPSTIFASNFFTSSESQSSHEAKVEREELTHGFWL
jgi:hypothetical protein